jgi:hypothetical protein
MLGLAWPVLSWSMLAWSVSAWPHQHATSALLGRVHRASPSTSIRHVKSEQMISQNGIVAQTVLNRPSPSHFRPRQAIKQALPQRHKTPCPAVSFFRASMMHTFRLAFLQPPPSVLDCRLGSLGNLVLCLCISRMSTQFIISHPKPTHSAASEAVRISS